MSFEEAWEAMKEGTICVFEGHEYMVKHDMLLTPPYGHVGVFRESMLTGEWSVKE